MRAIVTTGVGDYDRLDITGAPTPVPGDGEVLVQVFAAGMNNTEINTRLGWYSSSVSSGTDDSSDLPPGESECADGGWSAATPFPLIQGTDCCGRVVGLGPGVDLDLVGTRVIVRPCIRPRGFSSMETVWMGSDFDGAFAEFVTVPAADVFGVKCDWSDAELATIPCAYGTAENMVHRAGVTRGSRVLVTGASGGVGSAVVQLAHRRGAHVTAIASDAKHQQVRDLGADELLSRGADPVTGIGAGQIDVVIDNVAGTGFGAMLSVLRRGGSYVSSGAISGPVVSLDMRTVYLNDLTLIGCTAWDEPVFGNLVDYIERDEIHPVLAKTFPMDQIVDAQKEFLRRDHVGNFVLTGWSD